MSRTLPILAWCSAALGVAMCLTGAPWFRRSRLVDRLAPYSRRGARALAGGGVRGAASLRQVIAPELERWGERMAAGLGLRNDLRLRLEQAGWPTDTATFRLHQAGRAVLVLLCGVVAAAALRPPLPIAAVLVLGTPALSVLVQEHRLGRAVDRRQERIKAELPVVAEQLGLLLAAGSSLPGAVDRLARRSDGAIATDLRQVARRMRQGLSASDALAEWAHRSGVDAIDRLVAVLRMHDDAGDLGGLIAEEARTIRAAAHRELLEVIERRAQLVWIPVTVATLVPGLIFLAVPFLSAMEQVTGS